MSTEPGINPELNNIQVDQKPVKPKGKRGGARPGSGPKPGRTNKYTARDFIPKWEAAMGPFPEYWISLAKEVNERGALKDKIQFAKDTRDMIFKIDADDDVINGGWTPQPSVTAIPTQEQIDQYKQTMLDPLTERFNKPLTGQDTP